MKKAAAPATAIDKMFRAFSDRTRLRILFLLQSGECCVGNLVDILQIEQPNASRHLAYLRRAGLVTSRKTRNWIYYSLAPAQVPFHQKLLECLACCFSEVPEIHADQARAKQIREDGGCCPGEEKPPEQVARQEKKTDADGCCPA
jgi:ArsR family transcriptional regulator